MFGFFSRRRRQEEELPLEIYVSLVDWLYDGSFPLLSGGAGAAVAVLLTAWKTQNQLLWFCAACVALVTVVRALDMFAYERARSARAGETPAQSRRLTQHWELRYAVGAAIQHLLLGLWCFVGIAFTSDAATHMIPAALTLPSPATAPATNSARPYI